MVELHVKIVEEALALPAEQIGAAVMTRRWARDPALGGPGRTPEDLLGTLLDALLATLTSGKVIELVAKLQVRESFG